MTSDTAGPPGDSGQIWRIVPAGQAGAADDADEDVTGTDEPAAGTDGDANADDVDGSAAGTDGDAHDAAADQDREAQEQAQAGDATGETPWTPILLATAGLLAQLIIAYAVWNNRARDRRVDS